MPFFVYILKSSTVDRYYCGYSANPDLRLAQHNNPACKSTKTTKRIPGPWEMVYLEKYDERKQAMAREKQIKRNGIPRLIKPADRR